ncbi:hypothetical protein V8C35DRAFT_122105 [Trichoderma chlorosporum]
MRICIKMRLKKLWPKEEKKKKKEKEICVSPWSKRDEEMRKTKQRLEYRPLKSSLFDEKSKNFPRLRNLGVWSVGLFGRVHAGGCWVVTGGGRFSSCPAPFMALCFIFTEAKVQLGVHVLNAFLFAFWCFVLTRVDKIQPTQILAPVGICHGTDSLLLW